VLANERRGLLRRRRLLGKDEALDPGRQAVGRAAADDPPEQASVLVRAVELRIARADATRRMGQAEEVAVRDALAPAVLDRLTRESVDGLGRVPAADRATKRAAPAAEALHEQGELEQVRARSRDLRQRGERRTAPLHVAETRRAGPSTPRREGRSWLGRGLPKTSGRPASNGRSPGWRPDALAV
jgi:hypothetical protein